MNRMVAIVVEDEVDEEAREVACKVVRRGHIATVMLKDVQRDDAVFGKRVRDERQNDPFPPIQKQQGRRNSEETELLLDHLPINGPVQAFLLIEINGIIVGHVDSDLDKEPQTVQQVPGKP